MIDVCYLEAYYAAIDVVQKRFVVLDNFVTLVSTGFVTGRAYLLLLPVRKRPARLAQ